MINVVTAMERGWNINPEEFKKKHYDPESFYWKSSGVHIYNVLKKHYKGEDSTEVTEGISSVRRKCDACKRLIHQGSPVLKVGEKYYHKKCKTTLKNGDKHI